MITDTIAGILLIVLMAGTFALYIFFPDQIPMKLNAAGEPTGMQPKYTILMFPGIGVILFAAITLITYFLLKYNDDETDANESVRQRAGTVWLLRLAKLIIMTGLIVSVIETLKSVYHQYKWVNTICFLVEAGIVALMFIFVFKQLVAKYRPQR